MLKLVKNAVKSLQGRRFTSFYIETETNTGAGVVMGVEKKYQQALERAKLMAAGKYSKVVTLKAVANGQETVALQWA